MEHTKIIHIIFFGASDESFNFTPLPTKRRSIFFSSIKKISNNIKFYFKKQLLRNYFRPKESLAKKLHQKL
jgi:hypothetical protein